MATDQKEQRKIIYENNVIKANFTEEFLLEAARNIKFNGVERTRKYMVSVDFHSSFTNAIIRKVCREIGW